MCKERVIAILSVAALTSLAACASQQPAVPPATLVLTNARVVTVEASPARGRSHSRHRRSHRRPRQQRRDQAARRNGYRGHRRGRPAGHSGLHREPRPLHRCWRGPARAEAGDSPNMGRHPGDGRERGQSCQAGTMDLRPRLAPGKVDHAAFAERRGIPDGSVAQQGIAGQSRAAHARKRSCQLCQRAGDEAVGDLAYDGQSRRRRDSERCEGESNRTPSRDRIAADQARGRRAGPDRRGAHRARAPRPRAGGAGSLVEGHHELSGCRHVVRDDRSHEGDGRRGQARGEALGHGPRAASRSRQKSSRSTG